MGQHFTGALVWDGAAFREGGLSVSGGEISVFSPALDTVSLEGGTLVPAFVDLQVNGAGGVNFNDSPSVATLRRMAEAQARLGALHFLPTLITDRPETVTAAIAAVQAAVAEGVPGIAGLHLEGPHLSLARKGAHEPSLIRPMTEADLAELEAAARSLPALLVTLAPESVTADQIARLAQAGALVSLGHSDCSFETARAGFAAGARMVTHLFNAMSQLGNREPGLAGAALDSPAVACGLIADAVHVHPATLRAALAATGPERICLVSDCMAPAGTDETQFTLNGRTVLRRDGRLTLQDGTLAGADIDLAGALRVMTGQVGLPLAQVLPMATTTPARLIGRSARLVPGAPADFLHLGPDLALRGVWRAGARIA